MKIKTLILGAIVLTSFNANAQNSTVDSKNVRTVVEETDNKYSVQTNRFFDNFFVTIGGGAQIYFGDYNREMKLSDKDRYSPALDVAIGKWFTPVIGARVMYSGWQIKGATYEKTAHSTNKKLPGYDKIYYQKFNYAHFHGEAMFNMNNMFCGYKKERGWNISPYIGLGIALVNEKPDSKELTGVFGVLNAFRLSNALDLNLDVRSMLVHDRFDGETGGRRNEGLLTATIGLTYKFNKRDWNRSTNTYIYDDTEVNRLKELLNGLNAKNSALQDELDAAKRAKATESVVKMVPVTSPLFVAFKLGKSNLSKEARVNLGMLAEAINKSDAENVYLVTGYADKATGSVNGNQKLSEKRAKAVYDCLVNEFNVPAERLEIQSMGGVENMFYNDKALSRAVITKIK